jgi:hypothetical protein
MQGCRFGLLALREVMRLFWTNATRTNYVERIQYLLANQTRVVDPCQCVLECSLVQYGFMLSTMIPMPTASLVC